MAAIQSEQTAEPREPTATEEKVNFETISLLLSWSELGVLLAIMFRLARTFELIASTQRELRRAIHHLGEHRTGELSINNTYDGSGGALPSRSPHLRAGPKTA